MTTLQSPPPKTWASLFKNNTAGPSKDNLLPTEGLDSSSHKVGAILARYETENRPVSLLPRGIINLGNYCYVNAILQALIACPLFYSLMVALRVSQQTRRLNSSTPVLDALVQFCSEYDTVASNRRAAVIGPPLDGSAGVRVLRALRQFSGSQGGRQEDAEEFLSCLLNSLHDEMLGAMRLSEPAEPARTPLADIFRGRTRSRLHRPHRRAADTTQPFFTLQLDVQRSDSVESALDLLVAKEHIEGVPGAWQRLSMEHLPAVLVLHLKCFKLGARGQAHKTVKKIDFPVDLTVNRRMVSSTSTYAEQRQRQYKLLAVVLHAGTEAAKGHYVTDAFHGRAGWLRFDDSAVTRVTLAQVLSPQTPRVPYLLIYRRQDTLVPPCLKLKKPQKLLSGSENAPFRRLPNKLYIKTQTLLKLINQADMKPGLNENIKKQILKATEKMTVKERLCVILFDEMSLKANITYNERKDRVIGFVSNGDKTVAEFADHAQVFMVRGILKNYKQPVCYTFSQSATKGPELAKQLKAVISQMQDAGLIVVATVCDQGTNNVHYKGELPPQCKDTADILILFDKLFDSLNESFDKRNKHGKPLLGPELIVTSDCKALPACEIENIPDIAITPLENKSDPRQIGKEQSAKCAECDHIEDVYHILMESVRVEPERQTFITVNDINLIDIVLLCVKLVRLVETVLEHSKSVVAIQNEMPFDIHSGVKQRDAITSVVFDLAIEAVIQKLNIRELIDNNTSQVAAYTDDRTYQAGLKTA
ncbi:uncharacterized protein LOC123660991 [Melitaea cinxia]|uniref:uncharacterized protein LOC123660991 n=1 Tax=Melitaea cinxia TaxID=113334 RepID=UPI001E272C55|nr:uncharacterized protein LOC123660991 [Melitaea cinxia]